MSLVNLRQNLVDFSLPEVPKRCLSGLLATLRELTYHVTQPYQSHVVADLKAVRLTRTFISLKADNEAQPGAGATLRCVVTPY